jgi:soluble lytic murein transglycosylase
MQLSHSLVQGLRAGFTTAVLFAFLPNIGNGAPIDEQRELFLRVYESVERGDWSAVDALDGAERQSLESYVLWPDLRALQLRATIKTVAHDEIEAYLDQYGTLKPARDLRYRYALHLAKTGDLGAYLKIYQQFYQGLEITRLDCLALRAEIDAGEQQRVINRALDLWTVGKSQVDECDPVFEHLANTNFLDPGDYIRRFELAVEAREFSIARWLGKSIDQGHIDIASRWIKAQRDPVAFVKNDKQWSNDSTTRKQLVYAIERITYDDPLLALELWNDLSRGQRFSAEQELLTERHIALWMARDNLPGAYAQLNQLPIAAQNEEVLRWRARTSLRDNNWPNLLVDIASMTDAEQSSEEWRYWRGIALQHDGKMSAATEVFSSLAGERSYYGFLAADELGLPYAFGNKDVAPDERIIAELAKRADLIRARELFLVGLDGRGRSEWDIAISFMPAEQKVQAAVLASRWGWHSRAISAVASGGEFDDLSLRYPLPYQDIFRQYARDASIPSTWAYGVARSESLFMRDVRSSAGAIGLMQLMPNTGREVAAQIRLPYAGLDTLTNPQSNIRLGTTYLGQMAKRYGGNRVLATAAYNAGPHRVDAWLPDAGTIDARVWIENIPFNETRKYVRRVMAADAIFHWRITGETRRLSDELLLVRAVGKPQQVARN